MTHVAIDLAAYRRNLAALQQRIAPAELMVVVKADAYGHGLSPIAESAVSAGVSLIGVLDGRSGLALRAAGFGPDIRLFAWLFAHDEDYRPLIEAHIEVGVSTVRQLEQVVACGAGRPASVHLKIDTGLHRNGASESDWPSLVTRAVELERAKSLRLGGVWTHIGEASREDDSEAIRRFDAAIARAESRGARVSVKHLAASAAGFERPDARYGAVRVGAFTYGIAPGGGIGPRDIGITPVMTLESTVTSLATGPSGAMATVAAGYLHGIPSRAAGQAYVAIRGARHLLSAVGAGESEVLLSGEARPGDRVTIFGPGTDGEDSLQVWADALGTIGEELVVGIPAEVERRYRDDARPEN